MKPSVPQKVVAFNEKLATSITSGVSTMWCAYIFACLALYGATGVNWHNAFAIVSWISQTFLQLVLLSIIMVGQKVNSSASDQQAKEMHDTVMKSHVELQQMMVELQTIVSEMNTLCQTNDPKKW
ncbi:MAG: hypothetical protein WCI55_07425 [Armatimonadota bacterium]